MIAEKTNFGRYGKTFQEGLVQLIFEDRPFADQITEVLDINFLELEYLQVFLRKVVTYRTKYSTHPSLDAMMMSACNANENPTPTASPLTTLMTGKSNFCMAKINGL